MLYSGHQSIPGGGFGPGALIVAKHLTRVVQNPQILLTNRLSF